MNQDNTSIMEAFVSPHSLDDFFGNYWPDRHFAVHGDVQRLPEIFRLSELDDFLALARRYKGPLAVANGEKSPVMTSVSGNAADLYLMGLTVYLTNIESYLPGSGELLRKLETELGLKPKSGKIGVFAAPRGGGLQVHYDTLEIFSIQLKGTKRFNVAPVQEISFPCGKQYSNERPMFDDLYPQAINGFPDWDNANFETIEMRPGTFLYMPRGTWHFTEASDDESMSIGIGFETPSAAESILDMLRPVLIQDEAWRKPLYGIWGEGPAHEEAIKRADTLMEKLSGIAGNISERDMRIAMARSPEKRFEMIDENSRFQKVPTTHVESEKAGTANNMPMETIYIKSRRARRSEELKMRIDSIPSAFAAILNWISEQTRPFTLNDIDARFPTLDNNSKREVLKIAVYSELVRMSWFPELKR